MQALAPGQDSINWWMGQDQRGLAERHWVIRSRRASAR
jgi:hypothetical protein